MLGVGEAARRIVAAVAPLPMARIPIGATLGLVLADDVRSPVALPPWDNSAMDGYAVHGDDVASAGPEHPVTLPVAETIAAGGFASRPLRRGEAMRIMTGAPLPEGADSVVRVEDTDGGVDAVVVRNARDRGRNVRARGEDIREGDVVARRGDHIGPALIGVLASVGSASVAVHPRPRVAILGSGDELVDLDRFDEVRAGRRIVSSNSYTLDALVRTAGATPVPLGVARDTPAALREKMEMATAADLIVTSAGVSVGEHDYTRQVLDELGAEMGFWRVRMRPGAPLGFGILRGVPWIGLPGNPVSAMVTFELFVRPAIRRLMGYERVFPILVGVTLAERVTTNARLTHFLRAIISTDANGNRIARLTGPQGSGILTSMAMANALIVIPEDRQSVEAGERLLAIPLRDEPPAADLPL